MICIYGGGGGCRAGGQLTKETVPGNRPGHDLWMCWDNKRSPKVGDCSSSCVAGTRYFDKRVQFYGRITYF